MNKKLLGTVGVDSGQLMITDPCYIDSNWKQKEFQDIRMYQHIKTKKIFMFNSPFSQNKKKKGIEFFNSFAEPTSTKMSINEMNEKNMLKELEVPEKTKLIGDFSYAGICETTINEKHQINYKLGHPGLAIAFNSGYGDGEYPVYGIFNKDGRCIKVEIIMD